MTLLRRVIAIVAIAVGIGVTAGTASAAAATPTHTVKTKAISHSAPIGSRSIGLQDWWW